MFYKISKYDKFVPLLILMIVVARFLPGPAVYEGRVDLHTVADIGISLIFLFYGIKLNPATLKEDLGNWRLHLVVQMATFILFPALVLPFLLMQSKGDPYYLLWLGAFFLAALPSTVSSSVVMVSIAKGNIASAIFNASFSSLFGILITPMWMGLVISGGDAALLTDFGSVIGKLVMQVLVPLFFGVLLNRFFGRWAYRHSLMLKRFDQTVILLIVYLSFGESFYLNLFKDTGIVEIFVLIGGSLILFFTLFFIINFTALRLGFDRRDRITALFSGSKKSLVHGTVMSGIIFGDFAGVGVILLPLMVYHAVQLVIVGFIAQRMSSKSV
ncbi:bile acid:sodium symporter [Marinilabiliaceae bacterium ANBcel2]|nr:bile acid:sodium symporter [Marinilabiliaceae bacterium ANBcel2]